MKIYIVALNTGFERICSLAVTKEVTMGEIHFYAPFTLHWRWWHGSLAYFWSSIFGMEEETL